MRGDIPDISFLDILRRSFYYPSFYYPSFDYTFLRFRYSSDTLFMPHPREDLSGYMASITASL